MRLYEQLIFKKQIITMPQTTSTHSKRFKDCHFLQVLFQAPLLLNN